MKFSCIHCGIEAEWGEMREIRTGRVVRKAQEILDERGEVVGMGWKWIPLIRKGLGCPVCVDELNTQIIHNRRSDGKPLSNGGTAFLYKEQDPKERDQQRKKKEAAEKLKWEVVE